MGSILYMFSNEGIVQLNYRLDDKQSLKLHYSKRIFNEMGKCHFYKYRKNSRL